MIHCCRCGAHGANILSHLCEECVGKLELSNTSRPVCPWCGSDHKLRKGDGFCTLYKKRFKVKKIHTWRYTTSKLEQVEPVAED